MAASNHLPVVLDYGLSFMFHLPVFRDLNLGWIHFLMDPKLTPEALNPSVYDDRRFGVQQKPTGFPA